VNTVRQAYAHEAVLAMDTGADEHAPGGAITVALCGSWRHDPPCPLAPHHTAPRRSGNEVTLRLLFAAEPEDEDRVRILVDETLALGWADPPDGVRVHWQLVNSGPSDIRSEEEDHAQRLVGS
jgi:hypothetical protein